MTHLRTYAPFILAVFVAVAMFGVQLPFATMDDHYGGCPFAVGGSSLCDQPLAHVGHWQAQFTAVVGESTILTLAALVLFSTFSGLVPAQTHSRQRYKHLLAVPQPLFLQELFAQGILNRKAP